MAVCVCVSVCECVCQKISMYVSARSTPYEGKRFSVCMYAIVCFQLKVESVCLWENSHVHQGDKILRCVCVCVCVCVCAHTCFFEECQKSSITARRARRR